MNNVFDPASVLLPAGAVADEADLKLIDQVKLCLSIFSRRRNILTLTDDERALIGVEQPINSPESEHDALEAVEQIMAEILFSALPQRVQQVDLRLVVSALLKHIEREGGAVLRKDILLPDEMLEQLESEGILKHGDGGVSWGRWALQAIRDTEAEYGKGVFNNDQPERD